MKFVRSKITPHPPSEIFLKIHPFWRAVASLTPLRYDLIVKMTSHSISNTFEQNCSDCLVGGGSRGAHHQDIRQAAAGEVY